MYVLHLDVSTDNVIFKEQYIYTVSYLLFENYFTYLYFVLHNEVATMALNASFSQFCEFRKMALDDFRSLVGLF